jgi:hypothetical protein
MELLPTDGIFTVEQRINTGLEERVGAAEFNLQTVAIPGGLLVDASP